MFAAPVSLTPTERWNAVQERFAEGGAPLSFLLAVAAVVTFVLLLYVGRRAFLRWQRREWNNPGKLLSELSWQLRLPPPQHDLLRRMARDLALTQPAILLLSPGLFRKYADQWLKRRSSALPAASAQVSELAEKLFPRPRPTAGGLAASTTSD